MMSTASKRRLMRGLFSGYSRGGELHVGGAFRLRADLVCLDFRAVSILIGCVVNGSGATIGQLNRIVTLHAALRVGLLRVTMRALLVLRGVAELVRLGRAIILLGVLTDRLTNHQGKEGYQGVTLKIALCLSNVYCSKNPT